MEIDKGRKTTLLLITAVLVLAAVLGVLVVCCLPYWGDAAEPTVPVTDAPTDPPTDPPTEAPTEPEPTLPPPEENPYGPLDFQFKGFYLKLIEGDSVTGIDVSSHQKEVDWVQVKESGVDFAIIRIGYRGYESGKIAEDPYAKANLEGAAAAGLDIGVYFFSQALTPEEAEEEAYWVLDYIKDYELSMPVVYDWEKVSDADARTNNMDKRTLTDCSKTFLETIEAAGYWPMLYFNRNQAKYLLYLSELKEYDFWLAAYTDRMTYPYKVRMWQYTNTGRVPGIEGDCDINIFFPET